MVAVNRDGYVVLANEQAEKLLGYPCGDLSGVPVKALMPERYRAAHPNLRLAYPHISLAQMMAPGLEVYALRKDGSEVPVEINLSSLQNEDESLVLAAIRDISKRKQAETEQRQVNRALRAISACNQALIHAVDEPQLLQKICDVAVQAGGYRMAWVGYAEDDETKSVRPVVHAGYEEGYLDTVDITWADTERGRGPTGTAIRTGKTSFIRSFATDPLVAPWREQVLKRGYACSIALPLTANERTFGVLTIYSHVPDAFYPQERELLEQFAADLSFGINNLRARKARRQAESALRESEERFRQMVDHLQEVFWMANSAGTEILYINPAYEKIWGRSRESLYAYPLSWTDAIHPEDQERVRREFTSEASKGEFRAEYRIVRPEGSVRYIWHRSFPIRDESGNIRRVVGIAEDITERKQAEEDLRQRAEVIDQIHDSVVSTDMDGHMTSWNKGAERLFGYTAEEALGKHVSFVYPKSQHAFLEQKIIAPLKQKGSHEIEVRMQKKSGEEFYTHLSASLLRDNHGTPVGMIGYAMDITAQVRARESLKESGEKYRELTESITDVFFEMDSDLRYTYWNRTAERLVGISARDAIGKSLYELFPDIKGTMAEEKYLDTVRTQKRRSFESRYELHGKERIFDINVYPSKQGLSVVAKDVTERIQAEEALKQANKALRVEIAERRHAELVARGQADVLEHTLNALTEQADLDNFLGQVLVAITDEFSAHSSALWLHDPENNRTRLHATAHGGKTSIGPDQFGHPGAKRPMPASADSTFADFYAQREPFILNDPAQSPLIESDVREWIAQQGIKSILAVPVMFGNRAIGSLTVRNVRGVPFPSHEIRLAQALAHQVALGVMLTRLAEQGQQTAVLEERNRMAREMHDTLTQSLAGIILRLEVAEEDMSANPESVGPHLSRAKEMAREALAEARRTVWALRPGALESGDLPDALRKLCNRFSGQTGACVEFTLEGKPLPLSPDAENQLFRISQEAATNATKHAGSDKIQIRLKYEPDKVRLVVEDNGKGFSAKETGNRKGFGLISMRERAKQIGAAFKVQSSPGAGTQVIAELPIPTGPPKNAPKATRKRSQNPDR